MSTEDIQIALADCGQYTGLIDDDYGPLTRYSHMMLQRRRTGEKPTEDLTFDQEARLVAGNHPPDGRFSNSGWSWTSEANDSVEFDAATRNRYEPKELDWAGDDLPSFPPESNWPGRFVAHCLAVGLNVDVEDLRPFLDWTGFGVETEPCYGAICTFDTGAGRYVGFLHRLQDGVCIVTGGIDEGSVGRVRLTETALVACRWPDGAVMEQEFFEKSKRRKTK